MDRIPKEEKSPKVVKTSTVGELAPGLELISPSTQVMVVDRFSDEDVAGDYDWGTKTIRVSYSKVQRISQDVLRARRKSSAEAFRARTEARWNEYDSDTRRSALMTYLYSRVIDRVNGDESRLQRCLIEESVTHEARHAYDDSKGYRESIGKVGAAEALAILAQLEHSHVYERNLFAMLMEPYWLEQEQGIKPQSLHEKVGAVVMKTMIGFIEAEEPKLSELSLSDKMRHIAFLPPSKFRRLCRTLTDEFEGQLYKK